MAYGIQKWRATGAKLNPFDGAWLRGGLLVGGLLIKFWQKFSLLAPGTERKDGEGALGSHLDGLMDPLGGVIRPFELGSHMKISEFL